MFERFKLVYAGEERVRTWMVRELGCWRPASGEETELLDTLEQAERALKRERRYWRSVIADTIVALRATNARPSQITGALERAQIAVKDLEALSSPGAAAETETSK